MNFTMQTCALWNILPGFFDIMIWCGDQEDTYTGPHRILKRMGTLSYQITSHLKTPENVKLT